MKSRSLISRLREAKNQKNSLMKNQKNYQNQTAKTSPSTLTNLFSENLFDDDIIEEVLQTRKVDNLFNEKHNESNEAITIERRQQLKRELLAIPIPNRHIDLWLDLFRNIPFFRWDLTEQEHNEYAEAHDNCCCLAHLVGLPEKDGKQLPFFDYQQLIFDLLINQDKRKLWVKKATGLGISEFFLYLIIWLAVRDNTFNGATMVVVTGLNRTETDKMLERLLRILSREEHLGINVYHKDGRVIINNCIIETFPSDHIDSMRGIPNPKLILVDEGDFFKKTIQPQCRKVVERYGMKSNPYVIWVSTPKLPDGLFYQMEEELGVIHVYYDSINNPHIIEKTQKSIDESAKWNDTIIPIRKKSVYHRIALHYLIGVGKIYNPKFIEEQKLTENFEQEYGLMYEGGIGNFFNPMTVDECVHDDDRMIRPNRTVRTFMGVDTGYSSSYFAIVIGSMIQNRLYIMHTERYKRDEARSSKMVRRIRELRMEYYVDHILIDGSDPNFIYELKEELRDFPLDYHNVEEKDYYNMMAIPMAFSKNHYQFLMHDKEILKNGRIRIHKKFHELIVAFKSAYVDRDKKKYIKSQSANNDLLDATSMICFKMLPITVNVMNRKH